MIETSKIFKFYSQLHYLEHSSFLKKKKKNWKVFFQKSSLVDPSLLDPFFKIQFYPKHLFEAFIQWKAKKLHFFLGKTYFFVFFSWNSFFSEVICFFFFRTYMFVTLFFKGYLLIFVGHPFRFSKVLIFREPLLLRNLCVSKAQFFSSSW